MLFKAFTAIILLSACSTLNSNKTIFSADDKKSLTIFFTNNVNGELEPCGCRHFPLGGIDNAYAIIKNESNKSHTFFVDTGDTFFQTAFSDQDKKKSLKAQSKYLADALNLTGLRLKVLGDQDFGMGTDFLKELIEDASFSVLGSNISESSSFPHKKFHHLNFGKHHIYFLGITDPETIINRGKELFTDPYKGLATGISLISQNGFQKDNPYHHLVILSHSGMELDKEYAKKFPFIEWILGSHTQNFNQKPIEVGTTRIAQMLSRNHYLGSITFKDESSEAKFNYHEVNQDLAKTIKNNPLTSFLKNYKTDLLKIQKEEQSSSLVLSSDKRDKIPTATTCLDCHDDQGEFWHNTTHSLAYKTLVNNESHHNLDCLKCHSVGLGEKNGFSGPKDMVLINDTPVTDDYWKKVFTKDWPKKAIKDLSKDDVYKYSKHWFNTDLVEGVTHNYANVQCLNCHEADNAHIDSPSKMKSHSYASIKKKCLECHNSDQSNHWYTDGKLNEPIFRDLYKQLSCPKIQD